MEQNIYYYFNAVQVENIDGALRCKITRRKLDGVLKEKNETIINNHKNYVRSK
jgi:hypothetical protein